MNQNNAEDYKKKFDVSLNNKVLSETILENYKKHKPFMVYIIIPRVNLQFWLMKTNSTFTISTYKPDHPVNDFISISNNNFSNKRIADLIENSEINDANETNIASIDTDFTKRFAELLDSYKTDPFFCQYKLITDIQEIILAEMKNRKINKAKLAKKLGVTRAAITRFFQNDDALLSTLVRISNALDLDLILNIKSRK